MDSEKLQVVNPLLDDKLEQEHCNNPECQHCGSDNVFGITRIVGYFSRTDGWNKSKLAELKRRQQGNYGWVE